MPACSGRPRRAAAPDARRLVARARLPRRRQRPAGPDGQRLLRRRVARRVPGLPGSCARDGAHLVVIGAHDGAPRARTAGCRDMEAWFDHHVRGTPNGDREAAARAAAGWPTATARTTGRPLRALRRAATGRCPGTRWAPLKLDPARSGTARSINDGTLTLGPTSGRGPSPTRRCRRCPLNTDPSNDGDHRRLRRQRPDHRAAGADRHDAGRAARPLLHHAAALARRAPAGPAASSCRCPRPPPADGIWAVLSDVSPDGTPHPVAAGRLHLASRASTQALARTPGREHRPALRALRRGDPGRARRRPAATRSSCGRSATASRPATGSASTSSAPRPPRCRAYRR